MILEPRAKMPSMFHASGRQRSQRRFHLRAQIRQYIGHHGVQVNARRQKSCVSDVLVANRMKV